MVTSQRNVFFNIATFQMLFVAAILLSSADIHAQEITEGQQKRIDRIKKLVDEGGSLFKKKDYVGSAESIASAQRAVIAIAKSGNPEMNKMLKNDYLRIKKAKTLLEGKGQEFDELNDLASYAESNSDDAADSDQISFVNHVAPIIVQHCGQCHIDRQNGRYSAATYDSLKKGGRKGSAVRPRDIDKSRLISLIANGEMPPKRKADPVPEDQLQVLKDWIEQGAKFDGESRQKRQRLTEYVSTNGSSSKDGSSSKSSGSSKRNRGSITGLNGSDEGSTRGSASKGSGSRGSGSK